MPTPAQYLTDLETIVPGQRFPADYRADTDALIHVIHELARAPQDPPRGVVILVPTTSFSTSQWLVISQQVLDDLAYDDLAAWQVAAALPGFIHAEDLVKVETHINPSNPSPAIFDTRILRGDGAGYREMRVQGMNIDVREVGQLRITLLWRP